jgi:hypothetical protein
MTEDEQNPFDQLGLDPTMSPEELTEQLRRLAERLPPEERRQLRSLWRKLTLKDADRVEWAFWAHPRGKETGAEPLDKLRERVPPLVDRREPPPLEPTVADALLDFGCPADVPAALRPQAKFDDMAKEGRHTNQEPRTKNQKL